jgi:hypothetical protein
VDDQISGFPEVASLLWREREMLERVLFKIVQERLILAAAETRWLAAAGSDLEAALHDLYRSEIVRAAEVSALADHLGLPGDVNLAQLADAAPDPWSEILHEHRDALRGLTAEVDAATAATRQLLDARVAANVVTAEPGA